VDHNKTGGRHRRRRENGVARATLDEARRAGLVQRHLTKLRHLKARSATPQPHTALGTAGPSTPEPPPRTTESVRPALAGLKTRAPGDHPRPSNSETAA
jgi:hypothetical protein